MGIAASFAHAIPQGRTARIVTGGVLAGATALVLGACGPTTNIGKRPEAIAANLVNGFDKGIEGADQAATGERSLSLAGEHRRTYPDSELVDTGRYSNQYRKFDVVEDVSAMIKAADANDSGDATQSEIEALARTFDADGGGGLTPEELVDWQVKYGATKTDVNERYDRDLNHRGRDAAGDAAVEIGSWILGG